MLFEPALAIRSSDSAGEFIDFRVRLKFSAFLFAALIFFVTFLHQGKKVNKLCNRMLTAFAPFFWKEVGGQAFITLV